MSDGAIFQAEFAQAITAKCSPADAPPALAVYRNTWLKALLDALDANYPTVAMLLGAELFEAVALEFIREHAAQTPVLALYGAELPEFLRQHEVGREIPYLRDVAQLERLWTESFFAPDAETLLPRQYAALRPAQLLGLRAGLHPAARIARFDSPAVTIWQAHRKDGDFEEIEPEWRPERALVSRHDMSVTVMLLDEVTYQILFEIGRGRTISSAVEHAAEDHPGSDLAKALTNILESGALVGAAQTQRG